MDSVLPALLAVTIMLIASLVIGRSSLSSFQVLSDSWLAAEERSVNLVRSDITITSVTRQGGAGTNFDLTVRNDGATRVVDFSRMDVVVRYTSGSTTYNKYLDFNSTASPGDNEWSVISITDDVIDPSVLNTGETLDIEIQLNPAASNGTHWLQVTTELGVSAQLFFTK